MNIRKLKKDVKDFLVQDINDYAAIELTRASFAKYYNEKNILSLNIDDYVIGKGNNTTFCYKLEYGMTSIGEIRGATADKYWVYFDDKAKTYRTLKRFNSNQTLAFNDVKNEILSIIINAQNTDLVQVEKSKVCATIRRKLAYIYNPNNFLPIYMENDLKHFLNGLEISIPNDFINQQLELISWKKSCGIKEIVNWSLLQFSRFLYFVFGKPLKNAEKIADEILQEEIYKNPKQAARTLPKDYLGKKPMVNIAGHSVYPRNPIVAENAIRNSGFQCQYDSAHKSFTSKRTGKKYLEPHHLIPLSYHSKYNSSLDVPENIVALCSDCHNCVHYGKDAKKILTKLYNYKIKELNSIGITITLDELLRMYKEK